MQSLHSSEAVNHRLKLGDKLLELSFRVCFGLLFFGLREKGALELSDFFRLQLATLVEVDEGKEGRDHVLRHLRLLPLAVGVSVQEVGQHFLECVILNEFVANEVGCQLLNIVEEVLDCDELLECDSRVFVSETLANLFDVLSEAVYFFHLHAGKVRFEEVLCRNPAVLVWLE